MTVFLALRPEAFHRSKRTGALAAYQPRNADQRELGWTYWAWKYYDDPTGSSDEALVTATGALAPTAPSLSRAYPQAVAGTPVSFSFDPKRAEFHLFYVPKLSQHRRRLCRYPMTTTRPIRVHERRSARPRILGNWPP